MRGEASVSRNGRTGIRATLGAWLLLAGRALAPAAEPTIAPMPPAPAQLLDGRTYIGHVGEKGRSSGDEDTLRFAAGRFHSSACDAYGFGAAPYTAEQHGDSFTFTAETVSEKEGRMRWTGTIRTYQLAGSVVWTKPGQTPVEYWIKAELTH